MKIKNVEDYNFTPNSIDMTTIFDVEEKMTKSGSVERFFNLNDGVVVDGIDDLTEDRYSTYVCSRGDNLRFISHKIYGSQHYWWLIAKINHIYDAFDELTPGLRLKLLSKEHMNYIINLIHEGSNSNA